MRETEERARLAEEARRAAAPRRPTCVIHPDLEEALAAAEDALSAALGREVKVRAARRRATASSSSSSTPREGVDLAERILRRRDG